MVAVGVAVHHDEPARRCPAAGGDTGGWLGEKLSESGHSVNRGGDIVASDGEVLGRHEGSWRFTVGQRKGLRIGTPAPDGRPRYVLDIEPVSGTVTVGSREELAVTSLRCIRPLWCGGAPASPLECTVQLRAHGDEHRAVVVPAPDGFDVTLRDPASGVAPGQACVVYDDTRVVGSGTIASTGR